MTSDPHSPEPPKSETEGKRSFLRAAGLVSVLTLSSRFLGLARDAVLTACFGASRSSDIFLIAFEMPNLARRVLGEGSLSAFIVPLFTKVRSEEGREAAWRFTSNILTVLALVTLLMTALGILAAKPLFIIFGGYGYLERGDIEAIQWGVSLTRLMFPFLMLLALSSILMGVCHAIRRFAAPALGPIMLNLSLISAGLVFFQNPDEVVARYLAMGVLTGGLLRLLIMIPTLMRAGYRYRLVFEPRSEQMRLLLMMLLPAMFGLAVVQINISVSRLFAGMLGEGLLSSLVYGNRLVQLPLAIIASALATAILPQLSQLWIEKRHDDLRNLVLFAFRMVFILFIPATVGLMILGAPVIAMLFERGEWDAQDTALTFQALMFYAPGLAVWGMMRIIVPIYYAQRDVRTPVATAAAAMMVNVALNVIVVNIEPLRNLLGHGGLALANTISVFINVALLLWILKRRGLALWDRKLTWTVFRSLAAAAVMGVAAWAIWSAAGPHVADAHKILKAAALIATIALSAGVYFAVALLLKVPDLRKALNLMLRRGRKTR